MKKLLFLLFSLFFSLTLLASGDILEEISAGIKAGKSADLAKFFNNDVDLTISGVAPEGIYPKAKAELLLNTFFSKNAFKSFNVIHRTASKEGRKHVVGTYVAADGSSYRVTILINSKPTENFIQELKFEKE